MPETYLYAEVLTNIRQLTLYASLGTEKNEDTKISVSLNKKVISVEHDGKSVSVSLPTPISGNLNNSSSTKSTTEINCRAQIENVEKLTVFENGVNRIQIPWTAIELSPESSLACKSCSTIIIPSNRISQWKDLPSENWAELMDFWFCHKPQEDDKGHEQAAKSKGFSANSQTQIKPGIGLVDIMSFTVCAADCDGLNTIRSASPNTGGQLECSKCHSIIGVVNRHHSSWTLFKSRLIIQQDHESIRTMYPATTFICAQILNLIENTVSKRVIAYTSTQDRFYGLLLWIFNPDIFYSTSKRGPRSHRAMKVFYQTTPDPVKMLDEHSSTVEDLFLQPEDLDDLMRSLRKGADILPPSARKFQDWDVGLIDRYEKVSETDEATK